jgi:PAS domain S-box-containing protein
MSYERFPSLLTDEHIYSALFEAISGNSILVYNDTPRFTVLAATPEYLNSSGHTRQTLIGKGVFEAFPANHTDPDHKGDKDLFASFQHVLLHKTPHFLPLQRYDLQNSDGSFTEKYWRVSNKPVLAPEGEVAYIIHTAEDITAEIIAERQLKSLKGFEKAYAFFMAAPVMVGFINGDDYVIELANEVLLEIWGRGPEIIGKPLFEAIPELSKQGFKTLLDGVRVTGESFSANEYPITLNRHGKEEVLYFDFIYKPFYEEDTVGKASGIISVGHNVTAQVLAKRKIEESEAKYRTLFESMDQGFCILEMIYDDRNQPVDYRFLEANPVFEKQTGLKEAIGKTAKELVPDLETHWIERYSRIALTGEAIRFTEGSEAMGRWFDVYAFRVDNVISRKVALLFTDITDRKRTERAIAESNERFRNLADDAPMFVFIIDVYPLASVSFWNKTWLTYTGQTYEEAVGRAWNGIIHPDDIRVVMEYYLPAFQGEQPYFIPSIRVKRHDGEYRWHSFKGNPRFLSTGVFNGYVGVGFDVHEQKLSEEALRESEVRAKTAIDIARLGTFEINVLQQTIIHSPRIAEILGLDPAKQWSYQTFVNTVHPDDKEIRTNALQKAIETGVLFYEARVIHPNESIHWVRLNGRYIQQDGQPMIIGTLMDITEERKAAEVLEQKVEERTKELAQANEELRRSNQNLEEFAHAASHDLKEPVRKINFFTTQLKSQLSTHLKEAELRSFGRIENASERMGNLIDDLLLYSHVSQRPHEMEKVDLNEKVHRVLEDLELDVQEKGASISVGKLPVVQGYRRQLQQLFQNLISNALKYSKKDMSPRIDISGSEVVEKGKSYHLLTVEDNGIGFEQEYADKIFQMFTRLHGKGEYSGTGVGLSIVKKVVENHNGFISVESTLGEGSTFNVLLPV